MAPGKTARREKELGRITYGKKTLCINLTGIDKFCPITGKKLPKNGMVVAYDGQYYINWDASEKAALANG